MHEHDETAGTFCPTGVCPAIRNLVDHHLPPPRIRHGHYYWHPAWGVIQVTDGRYWGEHGISNSWKWIVISTGETKTGYGDNWPSASASQIEAARRTYQRTHGMACVS